jgi:hypothetical protein
MPFGDLVGRVRDPFGNLWWLHTRIEEVTAEQMMERMGDPEFMAAMEYVQGAAATALDPASAR